MLPFDHSSTPLQADEHYMRIAIEEAREAARHDEVPVGAVIVSGNRIIARCHNLTETLTTSLHTPK